MKKTSIGGSALIEGIMMIGPHKKAVAVRKPDGEIDLQVEDLPKKSKLFKVPFLRGAYALIYQMVLSIKALNYAASFYDLEDDEKEAKKKKDKKKKGKNKLANQNTLNEQDISVEVDSSVKAEEDTKVEEVKEAESKKEKEDSSLSVWAIALSLLLSLAITVGLFILLPNFLVSLLKLESHTINNLLEGVIRVLLFIAYLFLVTFMKDIKRVWMYHGAEHKTINCYEDDCELTLENVKKYPTANRRCGTGFMFLVLIVSIILFSFVGWYNPLINALIRILLFPVVAGIAYELVKLAGRYDNWLTQAISAPGMLFQKLTAKEPEDDMLECAIAAFLAVIPEDEDDAKW